MSKKIEIEKMKISDFIAILDEDVKPKRISARKARLIPVVKQSESEMALTSIFLSTLRLVKEFREMFFSEIGIKMKSGEFYTYTEVKFAKHDDDDSRPDGLFLQVTGGKIKNAILFEMKNKTDELKKPQIEKYIKIAKEFDISRIVTISNEFVSNPTQSPLGLTIRKGTKAKMYHFSWTYILTMAQLLLFKDKINENENKTNIKDDDQVEIMKEVVAYFEHKVSGVLGFSQMKGWTETVPKIKNGGTIKQKDPDLLKAVTSWQQEEKDMALILSRKLGLLVRTGLKKHKDNLQDRIKDDSSTIIKEKKLISTFQISSAVSDLIIEVNVESYSVSMEVKILIPQDKTIKGQLGWLKRQVENKNRKEPNYKELKEISTNLYFVIKAKHLKELKYSWNNPENFYEELKNKKIKDVKLVMIKNFGKNFEKPEKFVKTIEKMLIDFYRIIVIHLDNWKKPNPKPNFDNSSDNE